MSSFSGTLERAKRSLRGNLRLRLVAVSSLIVAFFCLGGSLLVIQNLRAITEAWGGGGHLSVYLHDGTDASEVKELQLRLQKLQQVESVQILGPKEARQEFLDGVATVGNLRRLPTDIFPSSLEVRLKDGIKPKDAGAIAAKMSSMEAVDGVESYNSWNTRISAVLGTVKGTMILFALLVLVGVLAIVSNTVRLSLAQRRQEVEVQLLCGATRRFVSAPFLLEGAVQGFLGALVALCLLLTIFVSFGMQQNQNIVELLGTPLAFLHPLIAFGVLLMGGALGVLASTVSLRRYLLT